MNKEYLDYVIETYNVDYVVHGEDPCYVDGKDVYETAKQAGKFRTIPRTEGVSTTDIVGRMLLMTKEHHHFDVVDGPSSADASCGSGAATASTGHKGSDASSVQLLSGQQKSKFLTTSRMLQLFSAGVKAPARGMHVVYIDGAWDLFHPGHVSILKAARQVREGVCVRARVVPALVDGFSSRRCSSLLRFGSEATTSSSACTGMPW
jgi:ethanolamine-phosphate cytidylyltransferase